MRIAQPVTIATGPRRVVARGLAHRYDERAAPVLNAVDLTLSAGELVMLAGPTGSGKTTLMTLIGALRRHQHGTLEVLDRELGALSERGRARLRREIGFIFQDHHLFDALTPRETLRLAMELHGERYGREDYRRLPARWLENLGLGHRMDALPNALSTGQRQTVAIARALVNDPLLILADEPTASLDADAGAVALACLRDAVASRGATVLMITHDARQHSLADRVIHMLDGTVVNATPLAHSNRYVGHAAE